LVVALVVLAKSQPFFWEQADWKCCRSDFIRPTQRLCLALSCSGKLKRFSGTPSNHPFTGSEGRKLRASRSRHIGCAPANSLLAFRPLVRQTFVGHVGSALELHRQFGGGVDARVAERLIICRTQFVT
jgi:hypothetical protein